MFITFGEDDGKWDLVLSKLCDEIQIYACDVVSGVYEDKKLYQLFRVEDEVLDHGCYLVLSFLVDSGKPVAGEIHKIPTVVDEVVVDKLGLSWCGRCLSKLLVVTQ